MEAAEIISDIIVAFFYIFFIGTPILGWIFKRELEDPDYFKKQEAKEERRRQRRSRY